MFSPSADGPKFVPSTVTTVLPAVAISSVSPASPDAAPILRSVIVGTPYAIVAVDAALAWSPTFTTHW